MSAPIDPANTSTSADGQTKHRALGATIDGDEPRVAPTLPTLTVRRAEALVASASAHQVQQV
jgi:hypothetical protein